MVKRLLMLCAAPALLSFMFTAPLAQADKQAETHTKVKASMVYLQVTAHAWVEVPLEHLPGRETHERRFGPFEAKWSCSGFVADPSGVIVTAGHCVDPLNRQTENHMRRQLINEAAKKRQLSVDDENLYAEHAIEEQWPVSGENADSPMAVEVSVIQASGPGRAIDQLTTARVTEIHNPKTGDLALLKISRSRGSLTPLAVAQESPRPGQKVTAVGFPAGAWETLDPHQLPDPSFNSGTASDQQDSPTGTSTIEINTDVSPVMSGGPTIDADTGEVLGVNTERTVDGKPAFNFFTDTITLRDFLGKNGVRLAPTKQSPGERVVVGAATAAATLAVLLMWLVRRKNRRPEALAQGSPQPSEQAD